MQDQKVPCHPARPEVCAQCPWRTSNHGKPHPHGFFRLSNLRRLWAKLRRGDQMSCHPTDPRMAEFSGYEGTANSKGVHECTGSLVLVQREFMRFQQHEGRDAIRNYRRTYPKGLLPVGLRVLMERYLFDRANLTTPDLNMEGVGHPDLPEWEPRNEAG